MHGHVPPLYCLYRLGYDTVQTILVAEDQPHLLDLERMYLQSAGYQVLTATQGAKAITLVKEQKVDLLLLDVMLPDMDGWEVCRKIRGICYIPVIMVTAKAEHLEHGLADEFGADDFMVKPFSPRMLVSRVQTFLQAHDMVNTTEMPPRIDLGNLIIDLPSHQVLLHGRQVLLSPRELDLLAFLAKNAGTIFSRDQLHKQFWGQACTDSAHIVDILIQRLHDKLNAVTEMPNCVEIVRGAGYRCLSSPI